MFKQIRTNIAIILALFVSVFYVDSALASFHNQGMDMKHHIAQLKNKDAKGAKKPIEIVWPKKGEVVKEKEAIEVKIKVADEFKDMIGHIHVYLNGKRLDHASIKDDVLLVWDLKEGENTIKLALSLGDKHEEGAGAKSVGDEVTFKVKTK